MRAPGNHWALLFYRGLLPLRAAYLPVLGVFLLMVHLPVHVGPRLLGEWVSSLAAGPWQFLGVWLFSAGVGHPCLEKTS